MRAQHKAIENYVMNICASSLRVPSIFNITIYLLPVQNPAQNKKWDKPYWSYFNVIKYYSVF